MMKQNIYDNDVFFEQYQQIRARTYNYNTLLEQPNFLSLLPTLTNKVVVDIGCGTGDFAVYCVAQGAKYVTGIDISANMIAVAKKKHASAHVQFEQVAFEQLHMPPETVDVMTSSLAFHYMANFSSIIEKVSTALCEGGIVVFSTDHPIVTANKGRDSSVQDEAGNIRHFAIDRYQQEGMRTEHWLVENVVMYHRTMSTIINTLIEHGLQIEKVIEPVPTEQAITLYPSLQKELRRPSFLIIRARKVTRM